MGIGSTRSIKVSGRIPRARLAVFLLFVVCATTMFAGARVVVHAATTPDTYQFSAGFSSVQGQNQWYYKQWDPISSSFSNLTWDATNSDWKGSHQYTLIGKGWEHPDTVDTVIAWSAPKPGLVTIRGMMDHNTLNGDGVRTTIRQTAGSSTVEIWPSSGWQDIYPNLVAQHIAQTTVATGDFIYFYIDCGAAGDCTYDTLNWDPIISYAEHPKFLLDKLELAMKPSDAHAMGFDNNPPTSGQGTFDDSVSIIPDGSQFDFYHSQTPSNYVEKFQGTLAAPAGTLVYSKNPYTNSLGCSTWITNMYQSGANLLGFTHLEQCSANGFWGLGLVYSTDGGSTFKQLGKVLYQTTPDACTPNPCPPGNINIFGTPFIIKDGYFYVYYNDNPGQFGVMRAKVSDVLAAAQNGTVSTWNKYYFGTWDQAGLGGQSSLAFPYSPRFGWGLHGDAAFNNYLGQFMMSGYAHDHGLGNWLSSSTDGTTWEYPTWMQHSIHDAHIDASVGCSTVDCKTTISPYETIVNVDGSDNGVTGQTFYVYFAYWFAACCPGNIGNGYFEWLFRQKVTVLPSGFDQTTYEASTGFDKAQPEAQGQWEYQQSNGSTYTDMTWDSTNNDWVGSETYVLVGNNWQHPGASNDSVRKWVAPRSGTVTISMNGGTVTCANGPGADGTNVKIVKNTTNIWPSSGWQLVPPGGSVDVPNQTVQVTKGDAIYFIVNRNGNNTYDTTAWDPIITYQSSMYAAPVGFSSTQGLNGWSYQEWNGSQYVNMTWDAANNRWQGSHTNLEVGNNWQQPDTNDAVRTWVAPVSGTVKINVAAGVSVANGTGADGVNVKILLNGANVWPSSGWQVVPAGGTVGVPDQYVQVNAGDALHFIVNQNGNASFDTTNFLPVVTYTAQTYEASDGFSKVTGLNPWSYQEWTGTQYVDMNWDSTNNYWTGSEPYLAIGNNWQHPGASKDSVRKWVAPRSGTVSISAASGVINVANGPNANGVNLRIFHGSTQVWPASGWQSIPAGGQLSFAPFTVSVSQGDALYFFVDCNNGNNSYDTTAWDPVVAYQ